MAAGFEVQNIYRSPKHVRKHTRTRSAPFQPPRATFITLRTVQLEEDDLPYRKGSSATIRSEGTGTDFYSKHGVGEAGEGQDSSRAQRPVSTASNSSMRVRRLSSLTDDNTRFPKLQDCAHFHYDTVDINSLKVSLSDEEHDHYMHNGESACDQHFYCRISSNDTTWLVRRTLQNFRMLDQKLHRCIFDRKFSHLPDLALLDVEETFPQELRDILADYLQRFSSLSGSMLNCGSVLNWLEIDNRGNRLLAVDDSGINTPAIAAAHAIKRYTAQAADEISLEVGDIVSVIDMPPTDDTIWWRGKRGFEVGFFPYECVEVIGDKVPAAVVSSIPETPQNKALMKKHGKFISFLRLFFNTRPARIQLKQSGIVKERVFGCDLGEHLLNSGHDVPLVLKSCTDVIESHGLVDGIYRLSGISSNIQRLRLAFDEDRVPDLTSEEYLQDVHSISSLLKMYFRELPNPLLTYQLYDKFADAVRDEDNKLLRIHDVVQQLPPPHYRTTEYLMRHLARVAAHGHETGMHSKNLAIVWAPNLLRSKELETGGGAAALRGVGIQAVVTEFLILYADIIFSDKMPSYSSPELKKGQKKPRPKSLAISTPTRLLSLEEARERALLGSIVKTDQKYIDVGGGPNTLPSKYHTVLDLPGYKKKANKDSAVAKGKKSPGGGLKSLFSRSRSGSIRQKGRKPSIHESLNFEPGERKAITEEDVQHWKRRRIRSAKSAESLLSLPVTSRLGSPLTESLDPNRLMNILAGKEGMSPTKAYRSLSIEQPRPLTSSQEHSVSYPSFVLEDSGSREMAIDVNPDDIELDFSPGEGKENSESSEEGIRRKQSFIRDDKKRKVICHRRTPSAPTTPRHDRQEVGSNCRDVDEVLNQQYTERDRSASQPALEGPICGKPPRGGKLSRQNSESDRSYLDTSAYDSSKGYYRQGEDNGSEKRKGSKTPPKDRKKLKEGKDKGLSDVHTDKSRHSIEKGDVYVAKTVDNGLIEDLNESPGSKRKLWTSNTSKSEEQSAKTTHFFYSRHHDYAEIEDDDVSDKSLNSKSDDSPDGSRRYRVEQVGKPASQTGTEKLVLETDFPASKMSKFKQFSSSDSIHSAKHHGDGKYKHSDDLLTEISNFEQGLVNMQKQYSENTAMTKCMSIPSDIQKSLDNIRSGSGSHSDLMSSVTLSELSMSQDTMSGEDGDRRRRSTSLDGLSDESPLSRTLREINAQIDQAFKHEKGKTQSLRDLQSSPTTPKGANVDFTSELVSYSDELAVTPTGHRSFSSMRDSDLDSLGSSRSPVYESKHSETSPHNKFVDRPVAEIHIADAPKVIRAPLKPGMSSSSSSSPLSPKASTPSRPSPPASLDIVSSTSPEQQKPKFPTELDETPSDVSPYSNVQSKTDFRLSEEDFQKLLMSDPDSMRQLEQSMLYSPVRSRYKGSSDGERSNRSSVMSPVEGMPPRAIRSNRSSVTSPEASPGSFMRQPLNRSFGSPEASPQSSRSHHSHSQSSSEASPQSRHVKLSLSSAEVSPQMGARQKHNQSYSSSEASPQTGTRQKHNQSFSSAESSPQIGYRQRPSTEASPQTGARQKHGYGSGSPSIDNKRYGQSPKFDKKKNESPLHERRSTTHSPKADQKKNRSLVSSPLSPEHKQPRWEDLAGLNDSFNELDLAVFNDNWKKCLAPSGDSIRQSRNNVSDSSEQLSSHSEFPEVSTGTDTVVLERPSITRRTVGDVEEKGRTTSRKEELEQYDNVPETFLFPHGERSPRPERPSMRRSHTVPAPSSVPQSPTFHHSGAPGRAFLEHSSSFESSSSSLHSGHVREVSFESPVIKKSNTTPALTRQRSFDSSYRSVKVTSMGSSLDEQDSVNPDIVVQVHATPRPGQGSYVAVTAKGNQTSKSGNQSFSVTAHHSNQSVLIRSESNQSSDFSFPERTQPSRQEPSSQLNFSNSIPQMLEEMDVNESCLGIASHQNMSNEMKEMMQEQMKNHAGILSPLDDVINPFPGVTSPLSQQTSFFDTNHPLAGYDMESSLEIPADVRIDLPEVNIEYLSEGPTLIATSNVLSQLSTPEQSHIPHQPIDNSEEEFQNAVNDDLERNLASLTDFLPQHVSVCEPSDPDDSFQKPGMTTSNTSDLNALLLTPQSTAEIMDTPSPTMQDSVSSTSSSQVDSMTSSFTYPQSFDSRHYYSPRVNSLNIQGDLAPPPLEMIEICKSVLVRSRPSSEKKKANIQWEYPQILKNSGSASKSKDRAKSGSSQVSSERGEEKLVMDNRPSLKKGSAESKSKLPRRQISEVVDSDHGETSGTEDEVFVDPSEVTPNTNFYAAGSKYFKRRDFLSYGHMPAGVQKKENAETGPKEVKRFNFDNTARCSMDESMMQMVTNRHDDLVAKDLLSGYQDDFLTMDIGHDNAEDIRFSKAHRSSKLLSLCEKFESGSGQSLNSDEEETVSAKQKIITPPEKNIVSSIRQMHESLEFDKRDGEKAEVFGKPQRVRKVSFDETKSPLEESKKCLSPTYSSVKDNSFNFDANSQKPTDTKGKDVGSPQGKPPKYRGNSKPRTPSESSLSENEGFKGSPKSSKPDSSPKSKYDGSPKGHRHSLVTADEASPKLLPGGGSPKGQRFSMEVSPKMLRGKEGAPVMLRHSGSPKVHKTGESSSKIPVAKQSMVPKSEDSKTASEGSTSLARYTGSPKNLRNSTGSEVPSKAKGSDVASKAKGEKSEIRTHRLRRGESVEERYNLNFERESPTRVHFDVENVGMRVSEKSDKDVEEKKKRRGSIKELTNVFEEKIENLSRSSAAQSPQQAKLRSRVRSVSPNSATARSPGTPTNVRHSCEIAMQSDGTFRSQQDPGLKQLSAVRIGPKPFYGAKQ